MKTNVRMKALWSLTVMSLCAISVNAQNGNGNGNNGNGNGNTNNNGVNSSQWKLNGNSADTTSFIGTTNAESIKFKTNNQERIRVTDDGRIGIGTKNPSDALEVKGRVRVDSIMRVKDSMYVEKTLEVKKDLNVRGDATFMENVYLNNLADPTQLNDGLMMLDPSGQVVNKNIGVLDSLTESTEILIRDNNGDMKTISAIDIMLPDKSCYQLAPVNGNPAPAPTPTWANAPGILWTGDPCPAKVGIGTSNPQNKLDVRGTTQTNKLYIKSSLPSHQPNNSQFALLEIESDNEDIFQVYTSGLVRAREIKVDQDIWPDYVFEDGYQLLNVYETEKFISENGHLPGVPSAKEVEEEGVELGEMNKVLLEKVEELTLHVIELQKQIDELKENEKGGE